jgi:transposase
MTTERRKYSEEFKREAVRLMESSGKPIAELARDLGVNDNSLYRWCSVYGNAPQTNNHSSVVELEAELKRLQRDIA